MNNSLSKFVFITLPILTEIQISLQILITITFKLCMLTNLAFNIINNYLYTNKNDPEHFLELKFLKITASLGT